MSKKSNRINFSGIRYSHIIALSIFVLTANTIFPNTGHAQSACAVDGKSACKTSQFCIGLNTGFFSYASLDRPFIDQARGAALSVDGYTPNNVVKNASIPLDINNYPTDADRSVTMLFHANTTTTHTTQALKSGQYVVLWDGAAVDPTVRGGGSSNVEVDGAAGRIEFTFDGTVVANTWFTYKNLSSADNVRNVRIVPKEFESDYAVWSWNDYEIGAATNPPIFFPEWLEKMSSACTIRYMNSLNVNDRDAVTYGRDSSSTMVKPSSSVWYDGFGLDADAQPNHSWPWGLVVESTLQTGANPWISFRVMAYENLVAGDSIIEDVSKLFGTNYGGRVYVEYANEIWNTAFPFNVATNHVRANGPGTRDNVEENYSLRNNAIQLAFEQAYGVNACNVIGVLASQGRNPFRGMQMLEFADLNVIDVLSPTTYFGDDLAPGNPRWIFVKGLLDQVTAGTITQAQAFDQIKNELLTGDQDVVVRDWRGDVGPFTQEYIDMATEREMCTAFYEAGLHMRVNGVDRQNPEHLAIARFMRAYQRSPQQAAAEKEVHDYLAVRSTGPNILFSSFENAGWGTFSYWDSVFEDRATEAPRASLLDDYPDTPNPTTPEVSAPSALTVMEGDGNATITLSLSEASTETVRVRVFTQQSGSSPGDAVSGSDFFGTSQIVEFAPGQTTRDVQVTLLDDANVESDESFRVRVKDPENADLASDPLVTVVTIKDDDAVAPTPVISLKDISVDEGVGTATVILELSEPSTVPISVLAFTQERDSAIGGQDYYGFTRKVVFEPGSTSEEVSITILDDTVIDGPESFWLRLGIPENAELPTVPTVSVVTIRDNDNP